MSLINRSNIGLKEEVTTMSTTQNATVESNIRPEYDDEIQKIADYSHLTSKMLYTISTYPLP